MVNTIPNNINNTKNKANLELDKESRELGLDFSKLGTIDTIEEYLTTTPGMVLAKVNTNCTLLIDDHQLPLIKSDVLAMSHYTYKMANQVSKTKSKVFSPYKKQFKHYFKRYKGQNLDGKKLLIWRTGGLGDICFTQPLIKYIKSKYPSCRITFGTKPNNQPIFKCWPKGLVDEVISIPFHAKQLKSHDYHITFEGSIERCSEAHHTNCYDIFKKVACLDFEVPDYPLSINSELSLHNKYKTIVKDNTVLIQMRASSPIRMLGSFRWAEVVRDLITKHGYNVGFIDSYDNSQMYETFIDKYELDRSKVTNYSKYSKSINEGVAILSCCSAMIGIDSSFTHIAAGLQKPILGLYGPFLGALRMLYYPTGDWIDPVGYSECGKWPCFLHQDGIFKCPFAIDKKPSGCMLSISKDLIIKTFLNLMDRQS